MLPVLGHVMLGDGAGLSHWDLVISVNLITLYRYVQFETLQLLPIF